MNLKKLKGIPIYGDTTWRGECPLESAEQQTFFNQLRKAFPGTLGIIASHQRNEGKRSHSQTARHRADGMTTGACDIIIPGCPSFCCELKRLDHTQSRISDDQIKYLLAAQEQGSFVCIALGWRAAWDAMTEWQIELHAPWKPETQPA